MNKQFIEPLNGQNAEKSNIHPILHLEVFGLKIEISSQNGKPNEEMIQLLIHVLEGNIQALKSFLSCPSALAEAVQGQPSSVKHERFLKDFEVARRFYKHPHCDRNHDNKY